MKTAKEVCQEAFEAKVNIILARIEQASQMGFTEHKVSSSIVHQGCADGSKPYYRIDEHHLEMYKDSKVQAKLIDLGFEINVSVAERELEQHRIEYKEKITKDWLGRFKTEKEKEIIKYPEVFKIQTFTIKWCCGESND